MTDTPGAYGWNASPEHRAAIDQEIARQRAQRAAREGRCAARLPSGRRCSRTPKRGSAWCWQHGH